MARTGGYDTHAGPGQRPLRPAGRGRAPTADEPGTPRDGRRTPVPGRAATGPHPPPPAEDVRPPPRGAPRPAPGGPRPGPPCCAGLLPPPPPLPRPGAPPPRGAPPDPATPRRRGQGRRPRPADLPKEPVLAAFADWLAEQRPQV